MMRVLVVEDDPSIRSLIVDILRETGHDPIEARDGEDAVRLARSERPDVVLMDLMIPLLDGAAAIRLLKNDPTTCSIPTVAMSASSGLLRGDELLADAVLPKPFDLDMLLALVSGDS